VDLALIMKYRVEKKYYITEDQIAYIRFKLSEVMTLDPNMKGDSYLIRSIYFDDAYNTGMDENESGVDAREKFRIRTYNNNQSFIRLECKAKKSGFCHKDMVAIESSVAEGFVKGAIFNPDITDETPFLLKKLWVANKTRGLSPVNIVEYERTAYIEPVGNVRITFDRNLGTTRDVSRFFADNISATPVLPVGRHILEVKYDEILPDYIKNVIDTGSLQRISYSKYYYSRIVTG